MIRRRGHRPEQEDESSSSDEEDAFSVMSRKRQKTVAVPETAPSPDPSSNESSNIDKQDPPASTVSDSHPSTTAAATTTTTTTAEVKKPLVKTSSMKRHHKPSDVRKANMEALIEELATEAEMTKKKQSQNRQIPSRHHHEPDKKGSFVRPEEEHLTTNIFVGGLSPNVTEEDLSKLFQEFGELYSVKIMWPRTVEERNRNRNTGFVCFMHRSDAEEAMALNETDPFNSGRLLMLRWGKNVKRDVRRGTGGLEDGPRINKRLLNPEQHTSTREGTTHEDLSTAEGPRGKSLTQSDQIETRPTLSDITQSPPYDETRDGKHAIRIDLPRDRNRFLFISTVAKFVSTDGSDLERMLIERENGNEQFKFLTFGSGHDEDQQKENLLYRWRIWSFSNGDTVWNWKTEAFVMFRPNGRYWIPPPLDEDAARDELLLARQREEVERQEKRSFQTGRQLERVRNNIRRRGRGSNSSTLTEEDTRQFHKLITNLSISREKICQAMVFCFERSMAANALSELLREALLDDSQTVTIDMKIARLYLLSDVLYNSQQPGVKNAFQFRTAIESMSPNIFRGLGAYINSSFVGRITGNKMRNAISAVLGAWTDWGVFTPVFLDDLEGYFAGREPKAEKIAATSEPNDDDEQPSKQESAVPEDDPKITVSNDAQGDWVDLQIDKPRTTKSQLKISAKKASETSTDEADDDQQPEKLHDAVKGDTVDNAVDDINGEDLDEEDLDGDDLDAEELDELDGEDLDGEDLDGEELGDESIS